MNTKTKPSQRILSLLFASMLLCSPLWAQKKSTQKKIVGYGKASYSSLKAGVYMKDWLLAGPFTIASSSPDAKEQENFFRKDIASSIAVQADKTFAPLTKDAKEFPWKLIRNDNNVVNLNSLFNNADYAVVYALAEIVAEAPAKVLLAVGSDDGIKVWLNGKLVHNNWAQRGVTPDQDVVPLTLTKGSNQILLKVQDGNGDWGFCARLLDKTAISDKLIEASARGEMDMIPVLLEAGANVNYKNAQGFTALNSARLNGRSQVATLLKEKGANDEPMPSPEKLVDGLYQFLVDKKVSGIAVLVSKDGKILYQNGFGYADVENKIPITTDTKFRIGSITKQFTASGILKLQEEGKLNVSDKLSKYIPDFPRGDEVTIHHLLTHTSGIHSYTNKPDFTDKVTNAITSEELINYFKNDPYDFNPGENYQYNNSGYFLLSYIIEKVSGKRYAEYLKETFFDPIGMSNTGVYMNGAGLTKEAFGYDRSSGKYQKALNWDMSWAGGAGALYSTVEDLYKWNEAIFNNKVLSPQSMKAAFTPVTLKDGKSPMLEYGYGWIISDYRGLDVIQHSGGLHGFASQLARFPDEHLTVAMLTNVTPSEAELNPARLAEFYLWDKMKEQTSYLTSSSSTVDLAVYEGRYDFGNGTVMIVSALDDQLYAQLTGQARFPIFSAGQDEFFWKVVEAKIKFIRNDKGEVMQGHFSQNGNEMDVRKLPEEKIISVDPAIYPDYAGKYTINPNLVITITAEGNKIFAQATNQQKLEIFPVSQTDFIVKEVNASLSFIREPDGKINKLILNIGGRKTEAPRGE